MDDFQDSGSSYFEEVVELSSDSGGALVSEDELSDHESDDNNNNKRKEDDDEEEEFVEEEEYVEEVEYEEEWEDSLRGGSSDEEGTGFDDDSTAYDPDQPMLTEKELEQRRKQSISSENEIGRYSEHSMDIDTAFELNLPPVPKSRQMSALTLDWEMYRDELAEFQDSTQSWGAWAGEEEEELSGDEGGGGGAAIFSIDPNLINGETGVGDGSGAREVSRNSSGDLVRRASLTRGIGRNNSGGLRGSITRNNSGGLKRPVPSFASPGHSRSQRKSIMGLSSLDTLTEDKEEGSMHSHKKDFGEPLTREALATADPNRLPPSLAPPPPSDDDDSSTDEFFDASTRDGRSDENPDTKEVGPIAAMVGNNANDQDSSNPVAKAVDRLELPKQEPGHEATTEVQQADSPADITTVTEATTVPPETPRQSNEDSDFESSSSSASSEASERVTKKEQTADQVEAHLPEAETSPAKLEILSSKQPSPPPAISSVLVDPSGNRATKTQEVTSVSPRSDEGGPVSPGGGAIADVSSPATNSELLRNATRSPPRPPSKSPLSTPSLASNHGSSTTSTRKTRRSIEQMRREQRLSFTSSNSSNSQNSSKYSRVSLASRSSSRVASDRRNGDGGDGSRRGSKVSRFDQLLERSYSIRRTG